MRARLRRNRGAPLFTGAILAAVILVVAVNADAAVDAGRSSASSTPPLAYIAGNPPGVELGITLVNLDGSGKQLLTRTGTEVDPAWAPDGRRIAFATRNGIWTMRADGGKRKRVTNDPRDGSPAWSPDGRSIAFERAGDVSALDNEIFVARADGTHLRRVTVGSNPDWSPDGNTLIFSRNSNAGASELYLVKNGGSGLRLLTINNVADTDPAWSPDGTMIAFVRDDHLFVRSANGGDARRLAAVPGFVVDEHPSWSPDGRQIVFARDGDVYVVDREGHRARKVTNDRTGNALLKPSWSPGGNRIAYADKIGSALYVLEDPGTKSASTTRYAGVGGSPAWSPTGRQIAFATDRGVAVQGRDGRGRRQLTHSVRPERELAWAPDGTRIAFTRWVDDTTPAVFTISTNGTAERRVTPGQSPTWSPDGRRIAFGVFADSGVRVEVIDSDGTAPKPLTPTLGKELHRINYFAVTWSPYGTRLAFSTGYLYTMRSDGRGLRKLSVPGEEPAWSPDGRRLAFSGLGGIWIADASGARVRQLTRGDLDGNPQWSPDGKEIAFVNRKGIWATDVSGGPARLVKRVPDPHGLSWARH